MAPERTGFVLEFEQPVRELRRRIEELEAIQRESGSDLRDAIERLRRYADRVEEAIFRDLDPWQRVQLSRHPGRPHALDVIERLVDDWIELHGDRAGHEDPAIVAGLGRIGGIPVAVVGHQKGRDTRENLRRNFGMARPEGYRKAMRVMELADRFDRPVVTLVDTGGAYPGVDAEARGQAEAIGRSILVMSGLRVPVVVAVLGEGGSGGALAIGVGNRVLMMEHAVYSVITPEGCAAILWRDRAAAPRAAEALRLTAADCLRLGWVDEVVAEPRGGAHRDPDAAIDALGEAILRHLRALLPLDGDALREDRHARFRRLGPAGAAASEGRSPA